RTRQVIIFIGVWPRRQSGHRTERTRAVGCISTRAPVSHGTRPRHDQGRVAAKKRDSSGTLLDLSTFFQEYPVFHGLHANLTHPSKGGPPRHLGDGCREKNRFLISRGRRL